MRGNQVVIGDFACMFNKVSEFLYKSHELILGFAVKKESFIQILDDNIGKKMIPKIKSSYQKTKIKSERLSINTAGNSKSVNLHSM
jgi:hypothetical protein